MTDIVERLRWWGAKRLAPKTMADLPADCAEAAAEIERLRTELEHFYKLAVDDPGKNPPTFWKDRADAAEKRCSELAEHGQNFANQVRAVVYHLNGQAYSSTVSELNQFDAELRRARALVSTSKEQE